MSLLFKRMRSHCQELLDSNPHRRVKIGVLDSDSNIYTEKEDKYVDKKWYRDPANLSHGTKVLRPNY